MAAEPMMPAELFRRHTATEYDVGLWNTRSATPSLLKSPVASSVDVAAVPMTVPLESVKPLISQRLTLPFAEFCSTIASPPMLPVAIARTVDAVAATLPAAAMTCQSDDAGVATLPADAIAEPFISHAATVFVDEF